MNKREERKHVMSIDIKQIKVTEIKLKKNMICRKRKKDIIIY
jgi:hypothetical protein